MKKIFIGILTFISISTFANDKLLKAVMADDFNAAKNIISNDRTVNPNYQKESLTPLTEASRKGNLPMMKLLLDTGADINLTGQYGRSALITAITSDVYRYNNPAATTTLELVTFLVKEGADVNITDEDGSTALMQTDTLEDINVVKVLVEAGANLNVKRKHGYTALMGYMTCLKDCTAIVKYMIEKGANVNLVNDDKTSLLMKLATKDFFRIESQNMTKLLLKSGIKVDLQDIEGMSALMHAVSWENANMLNLLIEKKAKLNLKNKQGQTALAIAKENKSKKIITILKKAGAKL